METHSFNLFIDEEYLHSVDCARHDVSKTDKFLVFKEFTACGGDRKLGKQLQ
jgi:hypothetical protein